MEDDPIIDEIRRGREEHARKFNYDVKAIIEDIKRRQEERGLEVVNREPRRILKKTG